MEIRCFEHHAIAKIAAFVVVVVLTSCSQEDELKTRPFRMGFTPFPYDLSLDAVEYTYEKLQSEADIINHHFDNGVPLPEALSGEDRRQLLELVHYWERMMLARGAGDGARDE